MSLSENHVPIKEAALTHPYFITLVAYDGNLDKSEQAYAWCLSQHMEVVQNWYWGLNYSLVTFQFKTQADAVTFSLVWS